MPWSMPPEPTGQDTMGDQTTEQARVSQKIEKRMKMRDPTGARPVGYTDGHLGHRHLTPLGLDQNFNLELDLDLDGFYCFGWKSFS